MSSTRKEKGSGNGWRFVFTAFFTLLMVGSFAGVHYVHETFYGQEFSPELSVFEFVVLILASFRLTRLFVYDSIMLFFRDFFWDTKEEKKRGVVYVVRTKPASGFRRSAADLLSCPWCAGVWLSLAVVFLHFLSPLSFYFLLFLAVAGVSSFIQLTANMVGWYAEGRKVEVESKR